MYKRQTLYRVGWADFAFAFHDSEEIGPRMLTRIAKHTGLTAEDLQSVGAAMKCRRTFPPNGRAASVARTGPLTSDVRRKDGS